MQITPTARTTIVDTASTLASYNSPPSIPSTPAAKQWLDLSTGMMCRYNDFERGRFDDNELFTLWQCWARAARHTLMPNGRGLLSSFLRSMHDHVMARPFFLKDVASTDSP